VFSERQPQIDPLAVDVVRLSMLPPAGTSFDSFAVSPDGRYLAFTAALRGVQVLWVRALDSLEARPLLGTEIAEFPFWSPDSRTICYFTPNRLKRIDVAGGRATDVAECLIGGGGSWGTRDIIVFADRPSTGILHQVPAAGGSITPATTLDDSRGEQTHGFPHFLPDGQHFVLLARSSHAGQSAIRVGSIDSPHSQVLLESETSAAYAPKLPGRSGALLFVSGETLMAQGFDTQRHKVHGPPSVFVPQLRYRRWKGAQFSVANEGMVIYQSGAAEHHQLTWFDREGNAVETVGPRNDYMTFQLSPDERYLAIYRDDDPATPWPKVWIMDLRRDGTMARLNDTESPGAEFCPVWSADGCELLFSCGTETRMRLFRRGPHGGQPTCVLDTAGPKFPSDWSRDGRFVAFSSQVPDYRSLHVWIASILDADTVPPKQRTLLHYSEPSAGGCFFPNEGPDDPYWIAYVSAETGRDEVYVRDFPAGDRKWQVSSGGGLMPRWRGDGNELFYLALDGTLMAVSVRAEKTTLELGAARALFATGLRFLPAFKNRTNQYAVSRDGERFLINVPVADSGADAIAVIIPR